jgi:glycosyltransferase involved in cell wall biosynthesis
MISIIISTRNRSDYIQACLKSILANTFKKFEILLADQSDNNQTKLAVKQLQSSKIRYFKSNRKGKSIGLNSMIRKARHNILAFTDDDCIVDKNWLQEINIFYKKYPNAAGVFGNVFPYMPQNHKGEFYTSTFESSHISEQTNPYETHWQVLGIGNNMSFRKSIIVKEGCFKEWLGPGSIALNGEETDLIFRLLIKKYSLMTNPNIITYHNRWLTKSQLTALLGTYSCGMCAFYSYYLFRTDDKKMVKFLKKQIITHIYQPLFHKKTEYLSGWWELSCFLRGSLVGAIFGIKDRFFKK